MNLSTSFNPLPNNMISHLTVPLQIYIHYQSTWNRFSGTLNPSIFIKYGTLLFSYSSELPPYHCKFTIFPLKIPFSPLWTPPPPLAASQYSTSHQRPASFHRRRNLLHCCATLSQIVANCKEDGACSGTNFIMARKGCKSWATLCRLQQQQPQPQQQEFK